MKAQGWSQTNLFGDRLELSKTDNPLEDLCCEACYTAKEERCVCRCHGAFHGLGNLNKAKIDMHASSESRFGGEAIE